MSMIKTSRLLQTFLHLVSIDSPSLDERRMADELTGRLHRLGFTVTEDNAGEKIGGTTGNLYAYRPGRLPGEPILFSVHMDTVEPSRGKHPIIDPDGTIRSDGTTVLGADDLAGVAELLEALEALQEENIPTRPLEILISVAEERHLLGSSVFDYGIIRAKEAYVLDLEAPVGCAAYKAPSVSIFEAIFHGKTAHAGFHPEQGIHAIAMAARAVSAMPMGRSRENTTLNVSCMEGAMPSTNIVPDRCVIRGEVRSRTHQTLLQTLADVEGLCRQSAEAYGGQVEFSARNYYRAYETSWEHPAVKRYERACRKTGLTPELVETFGGSDLNHLCAHGIQGLVIASAMYHVHSRGEFTHVGHMEKVAELLTALIIDEK